MDYRAPGVWEQLAARLARQHIPVPTTACGRVACEPGWSWRPTLRDYDLWLVLAGRGRGRLNGADLALHTGTLLVLRPGDSGSFQQDPDDRLTVVFCHLDFVDPADGGRTDVPAQWLPARHIPVGSVAALSALMQRVVRLSRDPHPLRRLESRAALLSTMVEVYMQDARAHGQPVGYLDPRLQEVIDFVRDQPRRRPSLAEAAAVAGLSPSHLSGLFSRQLGTSFRAYVLAARLERAHTLLRETPMTVAEVARALGYRDAFLFSRQFRQRYGQSPSSLRPRA